MDPRSHEWKGGAPDVPGEYEVLTYDDPWLYLCTWDGKNWSQPYGRAYHEGAKKVLRSKVAPPNKIKCYRSIIEKD